MTEASQQQTGLSDPDSDTLLSVLQDLFPDTITAIAEPGEQSDWSRTYEVHTRYAGSILILKGTPRNRLEAQVTARLHRYCPDLRRHTPLHSRNLRCRIL